MQHSCWGSGPFHYTPQNRVPHLRRGSIAPEVGHSRENANRSFIPHSSRTSLTQPLPHHKLSEPIGPRNRKLNWPRRPDRRDRHLNPKLLTTLQRERTLCLVSNEIIHRLRKRRPFARLTRPQPKLLRQLRPRTFRRHLSY